MEGGKKVAANSIDGVCSYKLIKKGRGGGRHGRFILPNFSNTWDNGTRAGT